METQEAGAARGVVPTGTQSEIFQGTLGGLPVDLFSWGVWVGWVINMGERPYFQLEKL